MLEYDTEKMDNLKSQLNTIKNNLSDYFDEIDNIMNDVGQHWEGDAASAFLRETSKAYYTYSSYIDVLDECIRYIDYSNSSKEEVEKKNNSIISNLFG